MTKALDEGHRSVLVPETTSVVFEENNGKLILIRYVRYLFIRQERINVCIKLMKCKQLMSISSTKAKKK